LTEVRLHEPKLKKRGKEGKIKLLGKKGTARKLLL